MVEDDEAWRKTLERALRGRAKIVWAPDALTAHKIIGRREQSIRDRLEKAKRSLNDAETNGEKHALRNRARQLRRALRYPFAAAWLDIDLPLDGKTRASKPYGISLLLRLRQQFPEMPVVVCSGNPLWETYRKMGANVIVNKEHAILDGATAALRRALMNVRGLGVKSRSPSFKALQARALRFGPLQKRGLEGLRVNDWALMQQAARVVHAPTRKTRIKWAQRLWVGVNGGELSPQTFCAVLRRWDPHPPNKPPVWLYELRNGTVKLVVRKK